jgi:pyruvate dehydrogenase E1 component alpha subunit
LIPLGFSAHGKGLAGRPSCNEIDPLKSGEIDVANIALHDVPMGTIMTKCGASFGIPGKEVDGMDVTAVYEAAKEAAEHARTGKGPFILEMKTYRYRGHSMSDPAKYRTREEVQKMREEKDAIEHVRELLISGDHASEEDLKAIDKEIKEVVNGAADFARDSPEPAVEELWTDIYTDAAPQNA